MKEQTTVVPKEREMAVLMAAKLAGPKVVKMAASSETLSVESMVEMRAEQSESYAVVAKVEWWAVATVVRMAEWLDGRRVEMTVVSSGEKSVVELADR